MLTVNVNCISGDWIFNSSLLSFSCSVVSNPLRPHGLQHTRLPCCSRSPGVCSNSCPLSRWGHPTISSSAVPFSSCLQSFLASGSFLLSWPFTSGSQSTEASVSPSVLPVSIQDWFPLGLTGWISLQSRRLSRVLSSTTVQKHQFLSYQYVFDSEISCALDVEVRTIALEVYAEEDWHWSPGLGVGEMLSFCRVLWTKCLCTHKICVIIRLMLVTSTRSNFHGS